VNEGSPFPSRSNEHCSLKNLRQADSVCASAWQVSVNLLSSAFSSLNGINIIKKKYVHNNYDKNCYDKPFVDRSLIEHV